MNLKAISGLSILVLLLGVTSSSYHLAFALDTNEQFTIKKDLRSIMDDYKTAVAKAKSELLSSIKTANTNAKLAVHKGIPMDEINAATKATIAKAKSDLKLDIQKAKAAANAALMQLKSAVDKNNHS